MRRAKKTPYTEPLSVLGLNDSEVTLYIHLVEKGDATVKELATRLPFPRTLLYHVLRLLEKEGLVMRVHHAVDEWRIVYRAANPKKLYELATMKEKEFASAKNALYEAVPKLVRDYTQKSNYPGFEIYTDVAAYAEGLSEALREFEGVILSYEDPCAPRAASDILERHERKRILKKVHKHVLCKQSEDLAVLLADRSYDVYTEFRVLPQDSEVKIELCELYDTSMFMSRSGTHEPVVLRVESADFVTMQRSIFSHLWQSAKPVTLAHIHV